MGSIKEFAGKKYQANDGSAIYFAEEGTFVWYRSDEEHKDNFYAGEYHMHFGKAGIDYIVNDLPQLGFSEEKMDEYLMHHDGSALYQLDNFCCMVLDNQEITTEGECKKLEAATSYYMGFYAEGFYDAANMQTHNYVSFTGV